MIKFARKRNSVGREGDGKVVSDLRWLCVCVCVWAVFVWQKRRRRRRRKKINIMSPNCLCVSLSRSLFPLHPLSLSPSHPTTLRQLLLCSQINCSPVAFGKCEINKCFASEVYSVFSLRVCMCVWLSVWTLNSSGCLLRLKCEGNAVSFCPPQNLCCSFSIQKKRGKEKEKSPAQPHPSLRGPIYYHHVILLAPNIRFTSQQEG